MFWCCVFLFNQSYRSGFFTYKPFCGIFDNFFQNQFMAMAVIASFIAQFLFLKYQLIFSHNEDKKSFWRFKSLLFITMNKKLCSCFCQSQKYSTILFFATLSKFKNCTLQHFHPFTVLSAHPNHIYV